MTEEYDGSSWTEVADSNTLRRYHGSAGTFSAGLIYGGNITQPPTSYGPGTANTETWNGVAWTEVANLSAGRTFGGSTGTQRAAFYAGGSTDSPNAGQTTTEEWDQSSTLAAGAWATGNASNTDHGQGHGGAGIQTAGVIYGGAYPSGTAITEEYDGSSWTESGDLSTARHSGGSGYGTQTACAFVGGDPNGSVINEEYNGSVWSEEADLNTARWDTAGAGSTTAALMAGGFPGTMANVEYWNGTAWTEGTDMNAVAGQQAPATAAPQTAAFMIGGNTPPKIATCEEYDGSSWTEVGDLNLARSDHSGAGIQGNAMAAGGDPSTANTELYDGPSWTETANLSTARYALWGFGTAVSAVAQGGQASPGTTDATEEWDVPQNIKTITD